MLKIPKTIKNREYRFVLAGVLLIAMAGGVTNAEWTAYNDCMRWSGDSTHQYATEYTIYSGETSNTTGLLKDIDTGGTTGMPTVTFKMNENIPVRGPGTGTTDSLFSGTDAYDVFNGKVDFSGQSPGGGNGVVYYGSRVGWWVDITFTGLDPDKIYSFVGTAIRGNSSYTNRFTRCSIIGAEHFINNSSGDTVNGGARARSADVTELLTGDNSSSTTGFVIRWDYITVADDGSGTGSFKIRTEATGDSESNYKAYPLGGFMLKEVGDIGNLPPMVYADGDKAYWLPSATGDVDIKFDADVYDDGLPNPPGAVTTLWSVEDKPSGSTVTFDDSSIVDVTATFDTAGDYVLRLTADDDGVTEYWDEVKVTIYAHDAASPSFEKGPYLMYTGVNTEMDVVWQIDKFATCFLKWGKNQSLDPPDGSVYTDEVSLGTYGHQHIYTITGLDTDTKYYYKIEAGVDEGVYETGSFRTAPAESATDIKFLAYGDTRTQEDKHNDVCEEMIETYTNRDSGYQTFLLQVGDWVANGDAEGDWSEFFYRSDSPPYYASISELQANLPIQGCMGNHEEHGGLFVKYWPYWYFGDSDRYGLFEYGPVRVVVADQYAYGSYSGSNKMGTTQVNWIKSALSDSTKKWNFLLLHQPIYTSGNHTIDESPALEPEMEDLFENEGNINEDVDIVFAGHNHLYARCLSGGVQHITTGGGGAPLHSPTVPPPSELVKVDSSYHFCEIYIRDKVLRCRARAATGSKIETFTLLQDGIHYYVKPDGNNSSNGQSWDTAFKTISYAITQTQDGDLIEVAEGTYNESIDFAGKRIIVTSTDPEDSSVVASTIIDANSDAINTGRVVTFDSSEDANSILTGFTITGGYAPGTGIDRDGGGIFCDKGSSPTISNCLITGNYAGDDGGGIFCDKESEATISNCTVYANEAGDRGGGMYCRDSNSTIQDCDVKSNDAYMGGGLYYKTSEPLVKGCTISDNESIGSGDDPDGGGIHCYSSNGTIINCIISDNSTDDDGGGIFCDNGSEPEIINCTISGNHAGDKGGGMYCRNSNSTIKDSDVSSNDAPIGSGLYYTSSGPLIDGCTISNNETTGGISADGGGIYLLSSDANIISSEIRDNISDDDGGGIFCDSGSDATITDCKVIGNDADDKGGGIYCRNSCPEVVDCEFKSNTGLDGGGLYCRDKSPTIDRCVFSDNSAVDDGGGIHTLGCGPRISNCFVFGNDAADKGGGMYLRDDDANLINCTITGNMADYGGGIYNRYSDTEITNCILWDDTASTSGDEIYNYSSTPVVNYSDVEGDWDGTGNINQDPCFVDASNDDYHLQACSPCIDVGDPNRDYDGQTDIDGDERVIDIAGKGDGIVDVDMGADEYKP